MKRVSEADSGKSSAWKVTVLSREEQYDLKRKVLIQEAARAFSTRGYHATSLADVARELGVTKGALYYYVKSKQDILFECHVNSIALGDRAIEHARSIDGSGFDSVVALARRYMELLVGESGPLAILMCLCALGYLRLLTMATSQGAIGSVKFGEWKRWRMTPTCRL